METLTPEQRTAFDALIAGKNVFLTGGGGTGKSHLISVINTELPDLKFNYLGIPYRIQTTALTGCAAILLGYGAKTVHSWAGIGLGRGTGVELAEQIKKKGKAKKMWNQTDLLIIDEISMMPAELLEKLNTIGQIIRKNTKPFGGIQLLLVGDFFQLPPVIRDTSGAGILPTEVFAFQSSIWPSLVDVVIELKTIHRQKDEMFRKILEEVRRGTLTKESVEILKSRHGLKWQDLRIRPTLLFPRKAEVDKINQLNLAALKGPHPIYKAGFQTALQKTKPTILAMGHTLIKTDDGYNYYDGLIGIDENNPDFKREVEIMDKEASYLAEVEIALDAQVMLIVNLDMEAGLVNGSRGVVVSFQGAGHMAVPVVEFINGEKRPMYPHTWLVEEYSTKERKIYRTQVPLKLAYAITIHKSQGASLDSALIDIGSNTFEYGQAYVALSRVRSLDALYIHAFETKAIRAHPRVIDFYKGLICGGGCEAAAASSATTEVAAGGAGREAPAPAPDPVEPAKSWLVELIPEAWKNVLKTKVAQIDRIAAELDKTPEGVKIFPAREDIWSALQYVKPEDVKVVILGQDPYPTEGNAHGLAFSVKPDIKIPASLRNIYKELESDLATKAPESGCLVEWAKQGVLLLNTILTVKEGAPLSHNKMGWEEITDTILREVVTRAVVVLWGKSAQAKKKILPASCKIIEAPHPSPLSAHTGFFGSKPFTQINNLLVESSKSPIEWSKA
jgi:ATP-dependent DNA helicase PIF1